VQNRASSSTTTEPSSSFIIRLPARSVNTTQGKRKKVARKRRRNYVNLRKPPHMQGFTKKEWMKVVEGKVECCNCGMVVKVDIYTYKYLFACKTCVEECVWCEGEGVVCALCFRRRAIFDEDLWRDVVTGFVKCCACDRVVGVNGENVMEIRRCGSSCKKCKGLAACGVLCEDCLGT